MLNTYGDYKLNLIPDTNSMWEGLGGNFDSFTEILNEFIDNSISNLSNLSLPGKNILISIEELAGSNKRYKVKIVDNGSGIKDFQSAFTIGNKSIQETPLNEHGYGMKHALAAANKKNDSWKIYSKTKKDDFYSLISAPYSLDDQTVKKIKGPLPSTLNSEQGTIVEFNISFDWLKTITKGLKGHFTQLNSLIDILKEDLGYTYGPFFSDSGITLSLAYKDNNMHKFEILNVKEVKPSIKRTIGPGSGTINYDLSRGTISIEYNFLSVKKTDSYKKHYLANMSTSGVEIRINGRLLADNIFSDIWGIDKHNSYNYLLIKLNLKSDDLSKLPKTTTNKTAIKQDDPCLTTLYKWIVSKLPTPKKEASLSDDETDLFSVLKQQKIAAYSTIDPSAIVTTEQTTFNKLDENIRIDLYQSVSNTVTIYEGKKDETHPKDIYQILMYWDGLVYDDVPINEGILIATKHPESVKKLVALKKKAKDAAGHSYNIILKTWQDENIDYPKNT